MEVKVTGFRGPREDGERRFERRKRPRLMLHWPVHLFRQSAKAAIESKTENLSSEGFYCRSAQPIRLGEHLRCDIVIPATSFGYPRPSVVLRCGVTVLRVERVHDAFGLGCHIDDYVYVADAFSQEKQTKTSGGEQ
jgi:hypothetical protein